MFLHIYTPFSREFNGHSIPLKVVLNQTNTCQDILEGRWQVIKKYKEMPVKVTETRKQRPAITPEGRENQMCALAIDLAEKQLREGTASSQVITHFLKLASSKEKLEKEILEKQRELLTAKTEALKAEQRIEELYTDAINAMKEYSGNIKNDHE